jgi:hypothetical protein
VRRRPAFVEETRSRAPDLLPLFHGGSIAETIISSAVMAGRATRAKRRSDMRTLLSFLAAATIAACNVPVEPAAEGTASAATVGPTIAFRADGTVDHRGAIPVDVPVVVTYDPLRLAACGLLGSTAGLGARLELFFKTATRHGSVKLGDRWAVDQGRDVAKVAIGPFSAAEAGTLELWFRATNPTGCEAFDSQGGANYDFQLGAPVPSAYDGVAPLIEAACSDCHGASFGTLDAVRTRRSAMISAISSGRMPKNNPGWKDTPAGKAVLDFLRTSPEL